GVTHSRPYNTTEFVRVSIEEVVQTLLIAIMLVVLTVYVFLQDWRATLIPTLTIPVSLVGTFGIISVFGFSINTLTLFGLVLAIGIVVDDAIVVVENTQRHLDEEGLAPREATRRATAEVVGPAGTSAGAPPSRWSCCSAWAASAISCSGRCPRALRPPRIKATCWSMSSFPTPPPSSAPTPSFARSRRSSWRRPASRRWWPSAGAASSRGSTARTSPP